MPLIKPIIKPLQTEDRSLKELPSKAERNQDGTQPMVEHLSSGKGVIVEKWITEYTILPDGRKFGKTYCIDKTIKQFNKEKARKPKQKAQESLIIKEAEEFE